MKEWINQRLTNEELEKAKQFGGTDLNYDQYILPDLERMIGPDKGSHKLRSIFHAPQHLEHWRKENGKTAENTQ